MLKGKIQLKDILTNDLTKFNDKLTSIVSNESTADQISTSNVNFNLLYSNFSLPYTEPLSLLSFGQVPQSIINLLYGSELELIDLNRNVNRVYKSEWLREQMCLRDRFLLFKNENENETKSLNSYLCSSLTDEKLVDLFVLISQEIEWTTVKRKVI